MIKRIIGEVVDMVSKKDGVVSAVKYLSKDLRIKATRKSYRGKYLGENIDVLITIGKPNYKERTFVKLCQKAKEPFPIKKIQIKTMK